jgi:XamI restriction endonuclease
MSLSPPRWSIDQLEAGRLKAIELFREQRMAEPLEDYLGHFQANEAKDEQEQRVKDALKAAKLTEVAPREIPTLHSAPAAGEFCGESLFGTRKADVVIRIWDHRVMALECKVSNSSTNSVKRLNNDAAVKAHVWIDEFGTAQTVPAAMLGGVFKQHNLKQAQERGLTIWWSHDLDQMVQWIEKTRP